MIQIYLLLFKAHLLHVLIPILVSLWLPLLAVMEMLHVVQVWETVVLDLLASTSYHITTQLFVILAASTMSIQLNGELDSVFLPRSLKRLCASLLLTWSIGSSSAVQ